MMKNIIFDLGRVLLSYDPGTYLEKLYGNSEKTELLFKAVFGSNSWLDLDRGIITEEEAFHRMVLTAPYPEEIRYLLYHWDEILHPIEGTVRIAEKLKQQNHSLYMLSNFHKRAYEKVYQEYSFFRIFDGIMISAYIGLIKPDPAIYRHVTDTYGISPETCVFIDDTPANVNAAKELGMEGIVFHDAPSLSKELHRLNIFA